MKGYGEETSRGRRRHVRLVGLISNPFLRYLAYYYIALKMLSQIIVYSMISSSSFRFL